MKIYESVLQTMASLKLDLEGIENKKKFTLKLVDHLENDKPFFEEFNTGFDLPARHQTITIYSSGYDLLNNRGIDIIKDDSLRNSIVKFYSFEVKGVLSQAEYWKVRTHRIQDHYFNVVDARPKNNDHRINYQKLKDDKSIVNWLKRILDLFDRQEVNISYLYDRAEELSQILSDMLESKRR